MPAKRASRSRRRSPAESSHRTLLSSMPAEFNARRGGTRFPHAEAERAGFEPATHLSARTRFPVALLRPLGHLSEGAHRNADYSPKSRTAHIIATKNTIATKTN